MVNLLEILKQKRVIPIRLSPPLGHRTSLVLSFLE